MDFLLFRGSQGMGKICQFTYVGQLCSRISGKTRERGGVRVRDAVLSGGRNRWILAVYFLFILSRTMRSRALADVTTLCRGRDCCLLSLSLAGCAEFLICPGNPGESWILPFEFDGAFLFRGVCMFTSVQLFVIRFASIVFHRDRINLSCGYCSFMKTVF